MKIKDLKKLHFETKDCFYIIKATRMHERHGMVGRHYVLEIVELSKKVFDNIEQYKGKVNKFGARIMFEFMFKESHINDNKESIVEAYFLFQELSQGNRKLTSYYVL